MRILLQRVTQARVMVENQSVGAIERGYVLLTGIGHEDDQATARRMAEKVVHLRLFPDEAGRFDKSLLEIGGGALVVSQFTLYGNCRKGRRPDFTAAAAPQPAEMLYGFFAQCLGDLGITPVATGAFGASMQVHLVNDGPVTLWLDSQQLA